MTFYSFISSGFGKKVAIGIVLLIVTILLLRSWKKRIINKPIELPTNGKGIPDNWQPTMMTIVSDLFMALDGIFTTALNKEKVFLRMIDLTDDQLAAVYNEFNNQHRSKGKGTMTDWIKDEWNVVFGSVRNQLVNRLIKIGAK